MDQIFNDYVATVVCKSQKAGTPWIIVSVLKYLEWSKPSPLW